MLLINENTLQNTDHWGIPIPGSKDKIIELLHTWINELSSHESEEESKDTWHRSIDEARENPYQNTRKGNYTRFPRKQ